MPKYNNSKVNDKPKVNYLSKDFISLKRDLINYTKTYFPNTYRDFNETSPGMLFMEMSAYVGDILSFYIDQQFKEMILPTVEERRNVMNLAKTLGYKSPAIVPAFVELSFKQTVSDDGNSDINRVPQYSDLMVFDKGLSVQSNTNSDVFFETLDTLDFSITGSSDTSPQPIGSDSNGLTNLWEVNRKVLAVSGTTKTTTFTISSPKQFLKLTLPDKDVINITEVKDSNNNIWYEVDYLVQDRVYTYDRNESPYDSSTTPVKYNLNDIIQTDRRFTVDVGHDNTTSLIFGNGLLKNKGGASELNEIFDNNQEINALVNDSLPDEIDPISSIYNNTLGEAPSNVTLTVTYRVGGGIKSNVPSEDLQTILNSTTKKISGGDRISTLSVTNINPARGGRDSETIQEIKEKSKAAFATQRRAVTREDYESRILSMPSKYGNIARSYVSRKSGDHVFSGAFNAFDLYDVGGDYSNEIGGYHDANEFENIINSIANQGAVNGSEDGGTDYTGVINDISTFINTGISDISSTDFEAFRNLNVFLLSYDNNKYFVKTSTPIQENLKKYLTKYKVLSDDIDIQGGVVINFGVKFNIESMPDTNKADLKLKCINAIIDYFKSENMKFNQVIYMSELENIIYNIDGVKIIHELFMTQKSDDLGISHNLYARIDDGTGVTVDGIPADGVSGPTSGTYGHGYITQFQQFNTPGGYEHGDKQYGKGVVLPPNADTSPGIFELKNPLDNVKGIVQ